MSDSTPPSEALIQLTSPDGYYTYLGIPKPSPADSISTNSNGAAGSGGVDEDLIKKNYRKLSLKHHPDKKGGDAETFRMLNRAQKVLRSDKLRQQYNTLGIDLDDEDDHQQDDGGSSTNGSSVDDKKEDSTAAQGIVHEIAGSALAFLIHLLVRTVMMCVVSVLVVRYRILLIPALLFMAFIAYRIRTMSTASIDLLSPLLLAIGLLLMYYGRHEDSGNDTGEENSTSIGGGSNSDDSYYSWSIKFWIGEAIVIGMFIYNSINTSITSAIPTANLPFFIGIFSILISLFFRGKFWNYVIILGIEGSLALFVIITFPIMEMVLEAILNDKLKKVGDKVRAHQKLLNEFYKAKNNGGSTTTPTRSSETIKK